MADWLIYIGILCLIPIAIIGFLSIMDFIKSVVVNAYNKLIYFKYANKEYKVATIITWLTIIGILLLMARLGIN